MATFAAEGELRVRLTILVVTALVIRYGRLTAVNGLDFEARAGPRIHPADLGWDSESLERSTLAVHEWIGLLWLRLRGVA